MLPQGCQLQLELRTHTYRSVHVHFMGLTRIDCHIFAEDMGRGSSRVFAPAESPGSVVAVWAEAARDALGSQMALRLALEHFVSSALMPQEVTRGAVGPDGGRGARVLENGFREANRAVFDFGAKLGAGGRTSASLLGTSIMDGIIAVARAGGGAAYLVRSGSVFPFFEGEMRQVADPTHGVFVGVQPLLAIEIASVPIESEDVVLLSSRTLLARETQAIGEACSSGGARTRGEWEQTFISGCTERRPEFLFIAGIGPEAIYLARPLRESVRS